MIIQFGYIQLKLLIPIIFPLFLKLRKLIRSNNELSTAFQSFTEFLSMICCGSLYLIIKFLTKTEKVNDKNDLKNDITKKLEKSPNERNQINNSVTEIINTKLKEQNQKKKVQSIFLILLALLLLTAEIIKNFFKKN